MTIALARSPLPDLARPIAHRTRGRIHGPYSLTMVQ
jgi:hypothetical protein